MAAGWVKGVHRGHGDNDGAKEKGRKEKDRATGGDSILRALPIHWPMVMIACKHNLSGKGQVIN